MFELAEENFKDFRAQGIGSSDVGILIGVSPWKTVYELWEEKAGIKEDTFKGNFATQRGKELEPMVRSWYNERNECFMMPERRVHPTMPHLRCNADGYDSTLNKLIEIKCGNIADHTAFVEKGIIPAKYHPQLEFLSFIFDCPVEYVSYNANHERQFASVIYQNDFLLREEILSKCEWFWNLVTTKTAPPKPEMPILPENTLPNLDKISYLKAEIKKLECQVDELTEEISAFVKDEPIHFEGYKLSWTNRKGNVDYAKVPQLEGVDLEPFRKPASRFFSIKSVN